jgi:hypothetical protein
MELVTRNTGPMVTPIDYFTVIEMKKINYWRMSNCFRKLLLFIRYAFRDKLTETHFGAYPMEFHFPLMPLIY